VPLPRLLLPILIVVAGCAQQSAVTESMRNVDAPPPVDFSGSWQRNYARDDEVGRALQMAYQQLGRTAPDRRDVGPVLATPSQRDADALVALARLAELVTRPDGITIVQSDEEIRIQREDDFSLVCRFGDDGSLPVGNAAGNEICGWSGNDLVSQLTLADGLRIVSQLTISADGQQLRVITTLTSPTSRVPFVLRRFYRKYDAPESDFHCIETLTMHRVCSTREIER
jgi:hypothetical protein